MSKHAVGVPKNLAVLGTRILGWRTWLKSVLDFGRSMLNVMGVGKRSSANNWERWGLAPWDGPWLTSRKRLLPPNRLTCRTGPLLAKQYEHTGMCADPPETLKFASRLSRSLKVIESDTDRSASYNFLLVIRSI